MPGARAVHTLGGQFPNGVGRVPCGHILATVNKTCNLSGGDFVTLLRVVSAPVTGGAHVYHRKYTTEGL